MIRSRAIASLLGLLGLLALGGCRIAPVESLEDPEARAEVADRVVATLDRQNHYFQSADGRRRFAVKAHEIARTEEDPVEFYRALAHALATLHEGHTTLVSSPDVPFLETVPPAALLEVDSEIIVAGAAPGLESGGLAPGDVILEVDGFPAEHVLRERIEKTPGSTAHGRRSRAVANLLAGPTNRPARVKIRRSDGTIREAYPLRFLLDDGGMDRFRFGFLSERVSAVRIDLATGYLSLPEFQKDHLERFAQGLQTLQSLPRLVLDLRGNPGGSIRTLQEIAGHFVEEGATLALLRRGESTTAYRATASTPFYKGDLRILCDERTGSAAELLAAALKDLGRATIYGRTTAGSTRSRQTMQLPGGVLFHYASSAVFDRADGRPLEGIGLEPDIVVPIDRNAVSAGGYGDPMRDPAILRAAGLN